MIKGKETINNINGCEVTVSFSNNGVAKPTYKEDCLWILSQNYENRVSADMKIADRVIA